MQVKMCLHNEGESKHEKAHGSKATAVWGLEEALGMLDDGTLLLLLCPKVHPARDNAFHP